MIVLCAIVDHNMDGERNHSMGVRLDGTPQSKDR